MKIFLNYAFKIEKYEVSNVYQGQVDYLLFVRWLIDLDVDHALI